MSLALEALLKHVSLHCGLNGVLDDLARECRIEAIAYRNMLNGGIKADKFDDAAHYLERAAHELTAASLIELHP